MAKNCKKCNNVIPYRTFVDNQSKTLYRRTYCLECSPYKAKKGQQARSALAKASHGTKCCAICERTYKWTKNSVCSTCRATKQRYEQKRKGIALLGGKCEGCGMSNSYCLTFHHKDPKDKKFELSYAFGIKSWEELEQEIKKCSLLCSNCHLLIHIKDKKIQKILDYYEKLENEK